ncbi:TetR/AcrR family transcriptional regulator [Paraglaciecola arctica]|uniref:HTH-type transcriptional regulator uidR n=1 Tax=Paraglaciecola arctica BSs20135 TaxID=493475 RepID=K6YL23_9ALTE|nr:TetR/AcrR family transcriptional regulator [Paraglaciecola arctica]GAC18847.1 HTH-type transcriptional regulator uidR [Paraglaciecola arctica BSs20135]|tara:strand:- start:332 stop:949 length:618 start_codon:yes stop_codon:yes gene_type:complete
MAEKITKRHADPALAEARRGQILIAAADCFRRKGYHGAGMAEISKTAEMSAGHIYNYFASKEAIIEAIIERDMEEMFSIFQQFEDHPDDLVSVMTEGADEGVEHSMDKEQGALQLEMLAEAARNPKVAFLLQQSDTHARDKMRRLLTGERSLIKDVTDKELDGRINVLFAMFGGLLLRTTLYPELQKDTILLALKPALRTLLMPF